MNDTLRAHKGGDDTAQQKNPTLGNGMQASGQNDIKQQKSTVVAESGITSIFTDGFFQFLIVLLLFVALLYRQTGLITLALLVLIMVNGAKLWCRLSLAGLSCRYSVDKEKVFPGEKVLFKAEAENNSFLPVRMKIRIPIGKTILAAPSESGVLLGENVLLWKQKISLQWELTALRRGCFQVNLAELAAGDLLGFFLQKKAVSYSGQVIVFPRLVPLKPFSFSQEEFFGTRAANGPVQDPVYLVATRDYRHGRPARHIHWKASARHNRLQEKVFEPTAQGKSLLVIDVKQFAENDAAEAFERTLEVAASLAVKMEREGGAVGIVSNGALAPGGLAVLPPARGPGQLSAILEILGRMQMDHVGLLQDIFRSGVRLSRGTVCTCFFLQADDSLLKTKEILNKYKIAAAFITEQPGVDSQVPGSKIYALQALCLEEGVPGV
ncbi:MAG: DUF58 domain-containing protein [Firmicutes bacterium]|nr:DUF58 domain-containing protein [Bacillota bacterium]